MLVWMREAVKCEQLQGLKVLVPANRPATWKDASGGKYPFKKSEKEQRFKFMAQQCMQGKQHFIYLTPAALTDSAQLLCCFCANMTGAWAASNRRALPDAELRFIQLLWQQQQSEHWCFQVQLPGWTGDAIFTIGSVMYTCKLMIGTTLTMSAIIRHFRGICAATRLRTAVRWLSYVCITRTCACQMSCWLLWKMHRRTTQLCLLPVMRWMDARMWMHCSWQYMLVLLLELMPLATCWYNTVTTSPGTHAPHRHHSGC